MASVMLLAGREAPEGSTVPWTLPEVPYPSDQDEVAGEGEGEGEVDTENPVDAAKQIDTKLNK